MTREEAIGHIKDVICENNTIKPNIVVFEQEKEALYMAIKALEQEPKIKVLDNDEVARKLGIVDIYVASAWVTLLKDLEYLGMKICEVEE